MSGDPFEAICSDLERNAITTLDLSGARTFQLQDDDLSLLAPYIAANTSVKTLNLSLNQITDVGIGKLANAFRTSGQNGAEATSSITSLDLSSNRLSDEGLLDLLETLPISISHLDVSCNAKVTDAFFLKLTERLVVKQPYPLSLSSLHARSCEGLSDGLWIQDSGAGNGAMMPTVFYHYLCDNEVCQLTSLSLSGNAFTDRSVPRLASIVEKNETLTSFFLGNSQIKDYFPIAEAVSKNDVLLSFPLSSNGKKLVFSQIEPKLKENKALRLKRIGSEDMELLRAEQKVAIRKMEHQHKEEVEGLQRKIDLLEKQVAALSKQ